MRDDAAPELLALRPEAITVEQVADAVIAGIAAEQFLILPHQIVTKYMHNKAQDYDRWLNGIRKLQAKIKASAGNPTM